MFRPRAGGVVVSYRQLWRRRWRRVVTTVCGIAVASAAGLVAVPALYCELTSDPPRRAAPSYAWSNSRLEEPLPFRPTADVLCRQKSTIGWFPPPNSWPWGRALRIARSETQVAAPGLTFPARAALTRLRLGGSLLTAQNASSRARPHERIRGPRRSARVFPLDSERPHTHSLRLLRDASSTAPRLPPS